MRVVDIAFRHNTFRSPFSALERKKTPDNVTEFFRTQKEFFRVVGWRRPGIIDVLPSHLPTALFCFEKKKRRGRELEVNHQKLRQRSLDRVGKQVSMVHDYIPMCVYMG